MKALLGQSVSCNNVLPLPFYLALCHIVYTEHKERWALQRGVQPLAAGAYVCISSSATSLFLSQSASLGATLCDCHKLVVSLCAGEGLVPVSAERRVTSGERSELRLQETPTTCCFLVGTPNMYFGEGGGYNIWLIQLQQSLQFSRSPSRLGWQSMINPNPLSVEGFFFFNVLIDSCGGKYWFQKRKERVT